MDKRRLEKEGKPFGPLFAGFVEIEVNDSGP